MGALSIALLYLILYTSPVTARPICLISNQPGLDPSGSSPSTLALQAALDECAGGGQLVFDISGTFLAGGLVAHGTIDILLPPSVVLLASSQREAYGPAQQDWYLLAFRNCARCTLGGGGTLDGGAAGWVRGRGPGRKVVANWPDPSCAKPEECRPRLLGVLDSRHVAVRGLALRDPVYWALHVLRSAQVVLEGLDIRGDWDIPNNDGLDVDGSRHVSVRGCSIHTGDDAVCIKTTARGWPTRHVVVTDCTLSSRSSAFKLGSETLADISDVQAADLRILDSHRGLAIQLRDGASIARVSFRNITLSTRHYHPSWWGGAEPVYVTAVPRGARGAAGTVADVALEDIRARAEAGALVSGPVRGLRITRSSLVLQATTAWPYAGRDYRPSARGVVAGGATHALRVEGGADVAVSDASVTYTRPLRPDWGGPLSVDRGSRADCRGVEVVGWGQQAAAVA